MKKRWLMLVFIPIVFAFTSESVWATTNTRQNEVGIYFEEDEGKKILPQKPADPLVKYPDTNGNKSGYLPHLGQMISSFILLLTGVTCLVVFCGVMMFRKIYYSV
ncbi:hypothetical protein [Enterococcus rotai]|uniref:hypothetical protein n=1 Tax=Enterococcus rotai TaxID=118060 RepID=UPI0032B3D028